MKIEYQEVQIWVCAAGNIFNKLPMPSLALALRHLAAIKCDKMLLMRI